MDLKEYDLHAQVEDVHWWFRARRRILFDVLTRFLPPDSGRTIAEIGCGTGGNLKYFGKHYRVVGTDVSPAAISRARERIAGNGMACEIFLGPFEDVLADLWSDLHAVLLLDVLEHVEDDQGFVRSLVARLKPGAILMVTVPAHPFLWSSHDVALGHYRRYSARSLRRLWDGLPVRERLFSSLNTLLSIPIVLQRTVMSRIANRKASDLRLPASWVNGMLYGIFSLERLLLRVRPLPWGISHLAVLAREEG